MRFLAGARIAHYEVRSSLGVGGMGEVYRARDTKLGRDVALKVLPGSVRHDPDRLRRLENEARVLAALNHPHIAAIYGIEDSGDVQALVLELVEGATLADRLAAGRGPVEEALTLGCQILDALDAAHERGIIHRDLKPANIKIAADGTVKLLDFGLAKVFAEHRAGKDGAQSPTVTSHQTQGPGFLGTPAYMSPEQARGQALDKRTDIWAFGCVLYEMLTGRAAFARATITDTLAAVVDREPQWSALPPGTSAATRRLLERCLEKDPRRRYRDVGDIRRDLEDLAAVPLVPSPKRKSLRIRMPAVLACAAALGLGAVAGLYLWQRASTEPSPPGAPVARFTTIAGGYSNLARPIMAWFPDGSGFVYVARDDTGSRLFVRTLNELQSRALAGSESGANPFLSPDGAWIGFFADRKLKKLPVRGGAAIDLSPITSVPLGASWTGTGSIVMGSIDGSGLWQVPLSGGPPQPVVRAPGSDTSGAEAWPQALPDGGSVLFTMMPTAQRPAFVAIASLASGERKPLLEGSAAQYIPTGHMVYARGTSLMGVRFDLGRLEVVGEPVVLLDGVLQADRAGAAQFNVATTGSLLYIDRADASPRRQLMLVDRHGQAEPISPEWRGYRNPRVSPDGQRIVADIEEVRGSDVWIYDRLRAAWNQLTFNGRSLAPIWTPDGKRVTYATAEENSKLLWKLADGSGSEELLSSEAGNPHSWSPDGRWLARTSGGVGLSAALAVLSMDAERRTRPFLSKEGSSFNAPAFSPDGRWLAYVSDESGRREIYVRGFPAGGQWRVSSDGGTQPMWARNGSELFYRNGDKMMAVDVATTPVFAAGTPKLLFEGRYESPAVRSNYDVTSDRRFVMVKADDQHPRTAYLTVVLNWAEELKRRIPVHR